MTENDGESTNTLLVSYIDKIANSQSSLQELQREIGKLRLDARADSFNMEAVHQLGMIVAKSPHDNGAGLLADILKYAHQSGIRLDAVVNETSREPSAEDYQKHYEESGVSNFTPASNRFGQDFTFVTQLSLGILVAGSLIWLLR